MGGLDGGGWIICCIGSCVLFPLFGTSIASIAIADGIPLMEGCEKMIAGTPSPITWLITYGVTGIITTIIVIVFLICLEGTEGISGIPAACIGCCYAIFWIVWMIIGVIVLYAGLINCIKRAEPIAIMMIVDTSLFSLLCVCVVCACLVS